MLRAILICAALAASSASGAEPTTEDQRVADARALMQTSFSDPQGGLAKADAGIVAARESGQPRAEAAFHAARGRMLNVLGRNQESLDALDAARALYQAQGDHLGLASVHRGRGVAYYDLAQMESAIREYLESLRHAEQAGDALEGAKTASNIGNVYWQLGDHAAAERYQLQALEAFRATGFKQGLAGAAMNLGSIYSARGMPAEDGPVDEALLARAEAQYRLARTTFAEIGVARGVAMANANLANVLSKLGRHAESLEAHRKALAERRAMKDALGELSSMHHVARQLRLLGRYDEALRTIDEALPKAEALSARLETAMLHEERTDTAAAKGDWRSAYQSLRRVQAIQKEIASAEVESRVRELDAKYDTERRERELETAKRDQRIAQLEAARAATLRNWALSAAALVLLAVGLVYAAYRTKVRAADELERMARTDALTGAPNRRALLERLEQELSRAGRTGEGFALVLADVDAFKRVNDDAGHAVGDAVLRHVVGAARGVMRAHDLLGRWGGEEFLLLLPATDPAGAEIMVNKLRATLAAAPQVAGWPKPVTLTFGITAWRAGTSLDALLREADEALYHGKGSGKDRAVLWTDQLTRPRSVPRPT